MEEYKKQLNSIKISIDYLKEEIKENEDILKTREDFYKKTIKRFSRITEYIINSKKEK